jgi:hypothetical protein
MRNSHFLRQLATWWHGTDHKPVRRVRRPLGLNLEPLEDRRLLAVLTIAQENQLPGAPVSQWFIDGAGDSNIEGFATRMSVDRGQTVDFKINTDASQYRIDIYRMGYYGGDGAREVATIHPNAALANNQPDPIVDASYAHDSGSAGLVDAGNWSVSASWGVPTDATSGIYFAKLEREDGVAGSNYIVFVVRNDSGNSDLLFKTSDETWEAYNDWGNSSLYGPNAVAAGRSFAVSYNRPLTGRDGTLDVFGQEYSMVRYLESNGYDVSYTSAIDVATNPSALLHHKIFLSVGHDEYWSGQERDNVVAARDAGLNLAFLSGNEDFWKTYWTNSIDDSSTAGRTLVCYKETHDNAITDPENPDIWTGTWRDARFSPPADGGRPENALTGTIFTVNYSGPNSTAITVPGAYAKMRFWRNTSIANLAPNATATLAAYTLGGEWDEDLDNGFRPGGLFDLSSTTVNVPYRVIDNGSNFGPGTATHSLTEYRAASGALVFGAGTDMWAFGLDGAHDGDTNTPVADVRMRQAMVNLFADMGAQPATRQSDLVAATASTDTIAPTSTITMPLQGAFVQAGVPITIQGTAQENGGGVLTTVEVSVDGGLTWHRADGLANWSYSWTPRSTGTVTIKSRAVDDSANIEQPSAGITLNPPPQGTTKFSLWNNATTPTIVDGGDGSAVELGVKFKADSNGFIQSLRFYKSAANTGTHTATLWSASGQVLATATFTNETASGWQQVDFANPVAVTAGTTYIASYHTNVGHYSKTPDYFTTLGVDSGPLHALANGASGGNGVYVYGASAFPTNTFQSSNYWVDVVLSTTPVADTTPPTVTAMSPAGGSTAVAVNAAVTISFSEALNASTVNASTVFLRDASNAVVAAAIAYDSSTNKVTLTPSGPLANSATYTVVVKSGAAGVKDVAGNALASDVTSSFTTVAPVGTPLPATTSSLWTSSATPAIVDSGDAQGVELGTKFTSDTSGTITGLRFYKSAANTGTHTASLWTAAGQLLATATFTNETASGWQQVNFAAPVSITAGTTYIASYHTNAGRYSVSRSFFGSQFNSSPLHVPANGGVYTYGASAFPTKTFQASNYWVDVVLDTTPPVDSTPPTVTAFAPANGASNVATGAAATVTFSEALNAATVTSSTVFLRDANSVVVSTTLAYNAATKTATLTPSAPLANSMTYTIVVKGGSAGVKDAAGNALVADATSSFSTVAPDTTPPTVTAFSPTSGASNVAINTNATVTFSEALNAATVTSSTVFLRDANNVVVASTVAYNAATKIATLTPSAPLGNSKSYTIVVKGGPAGVTDAAGNALVSDATSTFTTVAPAPPPSSNLWTASATPAIVDSGDTQAVELGVKFTSDVNGTITGLRFYKSAANTGTHTATLWTASGQQLATATFTNETASGWQQVTFAKPVAITAGTTYVASYHTNVGRYSVSRSFLASQYNNGTLHVPANGGVYSYGASAFPTKTFQASNYWIDVVFAP